MLEMTKNPINNLISLDPRTDPSYSNTHTERKSFTIPKSKVLDSIPISQLSKSGRFETVTSQMDHKVVISQLLTG